MESHQNDIMQSATAQIGGAEIVQFQTAQMPSFLNLTSFTNHIDEFAVFFDTGKEDGDNAD